MANKLYIQGGVFLKTLHCPHSTCEVSCCGCPLKWIQKADTYRAKTVHFVIVWILQAHCNWAIGSASPVKEFSVFGLNP